METTEVERFLENNQFKKQSYDTLSANNEKLGMITSDKREAYSFDEITEYIFPRNKPASADALLIKNRKLFLIEFKRGFERVFSEQKEYLCEDTGDRCPRYEKISKNNLKNIEKELKANLFQKAAESRWILEQHLLPEIYKGSIPPEFRVYYVIVTDKIKENPVDAMEQIMDEWAQIHRENNFYERMEASVKRLYCESRFGKKAFYDRVEVYSVQEFEELIS